MVGISKDKNVHVSSAFQTLTSISCMELGDLATQAPSMYSKSICLLDFLSHPS